ncbi:MAG: hypothetical protein A2Y03_04605 [Omnitrophica WOR_2 bacterium GWF2_38_59]|nr:MAG: hypothetical protein A2Y06_08090 [Omnitrophica WOR_2 bacterium GWA2_37_7]OGX25064.1 MAG: hypothetical protein A2Y03_04605 [Omnitrophica WOR_2 bacterium GWF2_38_59]OGX49968.1 MAG: hypothetical protein A2243_11560 [Omnitrophica WOR_2 bacterium RIFOXYA2_FULL_38_17]OGX53668.1 MAG: hypothetical protein A2267_09975 [Omnitrophica WOR_2 bacterium RIFOXYA12_FULL_38_10]OGX56367.1 MAG: hypothetical protein A2306_00580 [Omnitrophica WOR_2 bacterium RIFOXYB2_FULL_38_16]OGX58097.1 MAG: hypothetical 
MFKGNLQFWKNNKAQSILEYSLIIGIVTVIFFNMGTFLKRGTQGMIKTIADQIGDQRNGDQIFDVEEGFMVNAFIDTDATTEKTRGEDAGVVTHYYNDRMHSESTTETLLGFQEEED